MTDYVTSAQDVYSNRSIGISNKLINLDRIQNESRMVKLIIDDKEFFLYHAKDKTNRLSGTAKVEHLFKNVNQFSYKYDKKENALIIEFSNRKKGIIEEPKTSCFQFPDGLREKAENMAKHYKILFCLENSMRNLISDILEQKHGVDWWDKCVSQKIKDDVNLLRRREIEMGITARSPFNIDYITFGDLKVIVDENWKDFTSILVDKKAYNKIMSIFNALRGPIAHCCATISEVEQKRLEVAMSDWFERCLKR
ncbi:MAG: Swt1 family HEPN domain-containing protein [bacterium]